MQHALHQGSLALSNICQNWLFEGHLDTSTNWMIKMDIKESATNVLSNLSDSSNLSNSFNNSFTAQIPLLEFAPVQRIAETIQPQHAKELIIQVSIEQELVPTTISTNPEIIDLVFILILQKNVRF